MKYLGPILTLSLMSFSALATYPDEINYPYYQRIYQNHSDDLSRLLGQFQGLDENARRLYRVIENLELTFNNYTNEKVNIANDLRRLSDENRQLGPQRDRLIREERDFTQRLNQARGEYDRLKRDVDSEERRLRPLRDQINRISSEVTRVRNDLSQQQRNLQSARDSVNRDQLTLSRIRSDISRLESIPNRNPSQQSSLNNLYRQRSTLEQQISRGNQEVARHQSAVNQANQQLSMKENELRNIQNQYNRDAQRLTQLQGRLNQVQRTFTDLERQLQVTRSNITNTERRISSIRTEMSRLETRRNDIDRAQSSLRQQINSSSSRYNQMTRELSTLNASIERKRTEVGQAQYEFEKRAELYNRFLKDAEDLGRGQVKSAQEKGRQQGAKDAQTKGVSLGKDMGQKSARAHGNLWGAVRAEVLGYHDGYEIGYQSPRTDAQNAADRDALKAAQAFVETSLRPGYFEEVVQEEFKKPFTMVKKLEIPMVLRVSFATPETSLAVTDEEITQSEALVTPYDSTITQYQLEKVAIDNEYGRVSQAVHSYTQQTKYPFDKVNCTQVYKGVSDFKKACEDKFYRHYQDTFESAAYDQYLKNYQEYFNGAFAQSFNEGIKKQYDLSFNKAYLASKVFGEEEGKRDMYNEAYELQYEISYQKYLASEKARVRSEVVGEFKEFLEKSPLLHMVSLETKDEIIAGDELTLSALMRNFGKSKSGLAHLNIVKAEGVEVVKRNVTTPEVQARSEVKLSGPVVRVLPELVSGKTFKVEVEATLPGDNYQSARKERLILERKVSVSPKQSLKLNVDNSPAIRNVLRRFLIHTLAVEATPAFEDMKTDLDVNLVVLNGSEHMEVKVGTQKIQKMKKGQKANLKFSYVFKDSAKGKSINLALEFIYKGRVIQTEHIELMPH